MNPDRFGRRGSDKAGFSVLVFVGTNREKSAFCGRRGLGLQSDKAGFKLRFGCLSGQIGKNRLFVVVEV